MDKKLSITTIPISKITLSSNSALKSPLKGEDGSKKVEVGNKTCFYKDSIYFTQELASPPPFLTPVTPNSGFTDVTAKNFDWRETRNEKYEKKSPRILSLCPFDSKISHHSENLKNFKAKAGNVNNLKRKSVQFGQGHENFSHTVRRRKPSHNLRSAYKPLSSPKFEKFDHKRKLRNIYSSERVHQL